jgi:phosphoglycerate dehydrogenase-like enzyme
VVYINKAKPLKELKQLLEDKEEKVLAIDPDFWAWNAPKELTQTVKNIKAICLQSTSFSWLDVDIAKKNKVPVVNLRGFPTIAVAEWATMMTLTVARKIPLIAKNKWKMDYDTQKGLELRGRIAGIVGLGKIGTAISENMKGLGMNVQYYSKHSTDKRFKKVALAQLFKTSDVILLVLAKNAETKKLISDAMLKSMKKDAMFISVVHEIYNHALLLDMVAKGKIFGFGFEEQKGKLLSYKGNVWAGPEMAWYTEESVKKNAEQWTQGILEAAKGKFPNKVN